nr:NAD-dependent epimerase/dehydratase family protein [Mycolicibacterium chubuense]
MTTQGIGSRRHVLTAISGPRCGTLPRIRAVKVLVTGGTGFTGSHTAAALMAAGHDVRLMVRDPAKVRRVFDPLGLVPTDVVTADMVDHAAVEDALAGCDGVIHTAALVDLRRASASLVENTNTRGAEVVIGAAADRGVTRIVHVSSLTVFFRPGGPPMTTTMPIVDGSTAYARSKARAERYVRRLQDSGAGIRISYPAGIVGPHDPGPSAVNAGLASFLHDTFLITTGGLQIVDVRDLARLHVTLLELPPGPDRYVAASEMLTWPQIYELCCRLTGTRPRKVTVPGFLLRAAGTVGDIAKRLHDFDFPLTRDAMEVGTRWPGADTERTTRELGVRFRDPADTLRDTLRWMYSAGHLSAAEVGKLAAEAVPS